MASTVFTPLSARRFCGPIFSFACALLLAGAISASSAVERIIPAAADAHVGGDNASFDKNFGLTEELHLRFYHTGNYRGNSRKVYVRFPVGSLAGMTIEEARLLFDLTAEPDAEQTLHVYALVHGDPGVHWVEGSGEERVRSDTGFVEASPPSPITWRLAPANDLAVGGGAPGDSDTGGDPETAGGLRSDRVIWLGKFSVAPEISPAGSETGLLGSNAPLIAFLEERGDREAVTFILVAEENRNQLVRLAAREHPDLNGPRLEVRGEEIRSTSIEEWRQHYFSAAERRDFEVSGDFAAPAGDGVANLLKYALGLGPRESVAGCFPWIDFDGENLLVSHWQVPGANDVAYRMEISGDLVEWEAGDTVLEEAGVVEVGDIAVRSLRDGEAGARPKRFYRLRAVRDRGSAGGPRLFFDRDELADLYRLVRDGKRRALWDETVERALAFSTPGSSRYLAPENTGDIPGSWLEGYGRELSHRLEVVGFVYQLTGSGELGRYGAEVLAEAARSLPVTHPGIARGQALAGARGDMMRVFATGYDWLGEMLTAPEREEVVATSLEYLKEAYIESAGGGFGDYHNFNGVVMGAAGALAICFREEHPDVAEPVIGEAIRTIRNWFDRAFDPEGAYHEGTGYVGYGLDNVFLFADALNRAGGADLLDHPHLRRLSHYYAMSQLPGDRVFDSRGSAFYTGSPQLIMLKLAQTYGDKLARWFADETSAESSSPFRILYENDVAAKSPVEIGTPLDEHFTGRGLVVFRTGWEKDDLMFSMEAGPAYPGAHNYADEGHFTFYGFGRRWAADPGSRNHAGHFHNTVLVNGVGQALSGRGYGTSGAILDYETADSYGYALADLTDAYRRNTADVPGVPLAHARRHTFFVRPTADNPGYAVVLDDMEKDGQPHRFTWLLQTASEMETKHRPEGVVVRPAPAYGGAYVKNAGGSAEAGTVTWNVHVDEPGDYHLWARVRAERPPLIAPSDAGSYFVRVNGGSEFAWNIPYTWQYDWIWAPVRSPDTPVPALPPDLGDDLHAHVRSGDPEILQEIALTWHTFKSLRRFFPEQAYVVTPFSLEEGQNEIRFRARGPGSHIDRIVLARDAGARPPLAFDDPDTIVIDAQDGAVFGQMEVVPETAGEISPRLHVVLNASGPVSFEEDTYLYRPRIRASVDAVNPRFAAVLVPLPHGAPEPEFAFEQTGGETVIEMRWANRVDRFAWPQDKDGKATFSVEAP